MIFSIWITGHRHPFGSLPAVEPQCQLDSSLTSHPPFPLFQICGVFPHSSPLLLNESHLQCSTCDLAIKHLHLLHQFVALTLPGLCGRDHVAGRVLDPLKSSEATAILPSVLSFHKLHPYQFGVVKCYQGCFGFAN